MCDQGGGQRGDKNGRVNRWTVQCGDKALAHTGKVPEQEGRKSLGGDLSSC